MRYKHFAWWKVNLYKKRTHEEDKAILRKEIDVATVEYLKKNKITYLPNSPNIKGYSVKVKDLREISDTKEFYYLEEENEDNLY